MTPAEHREDWASTLRAAMWREIAARVDEEGHALVPGFLSTSDIARWTGASARAEMEVLRETIYEALVPLANAWGTRWRAATEFPSRFVTWREGLARGGVVLEMPQMSTLDREQSLPLLHSTSTRSAFPFAAAVLLDEPERDFIGGDFVIVEQRPRRQSRAIVVPMRRGDLVIFAGGDRPVSGTRGDYRARMSRGIGRVIDGRRRGVEIRFADGVVPA